MLSEIEIYSLSQIKQVGDKTLKQLLELFNKSNVSSLRELDPLFIQNSTKLKKVVTEELVKFWHDLDHWLDTSAEFIGQLNRQGISVISTEDPRYSPYLNLCSDAPSLLYCRGNLDLLRDRHSVAVVGTRDNTSVGRQITERTVSWLVENGQTIVSGLALGIDTIAHESCLKNNGRTIAVLVDVNKIHPSSNNPLAHRILDQGGLLIAENAPGTASVPPLFVKRDRIQTGLSTAVFPIETSINGGTMHAVRAAARSRYNRLVFAPDITKGMYSEPGIEQIQGIKSLLDNRLAEPYDRSRYSSVKQSIAEKEQELSKQIAEHSSASEPTEMRQSLLV